MFIERKSQDWTDDELRLAFLRLLTLRDEECYAVLPTKELMNLGVSLERLEQTMLWLSEQDFVEGKHREVSVTAKGLEYLGTEETPPEDLAHVPRRPLPGSGNTSVALPQPVTEVSEEATGL